MEALASLGDKGAEVGAQLASGTLPQVSLLPHAVRIIVEDIYAQAIASSFLIAVPVALVSLIAIIFLPNHPLTNLTTSQRLAASEAALATDASGEGIAMVASEIAADDYSADITLEQQARASRAEARQGGPSSHEHSPR